MLHIIYVDISRMCEPRTDFIVTGQKKEESEYQLLTDGKFDNIGARLERSSESLKIP
jgi:hypothetical protein